jgi:anti-sigma regulatory factor (Ser/Thr protein kinase)
MMPLPTRVTIRLHATLEYRPIAIDLVAALIGHVPLTDAVFHNEMLTAFSEAFNNVATRGYRDRSDGMLDVEAEIGAGVLILRLTDEGLPLDFDTIPAPDLDSMPESGTSMFLLHASVDEVSYVRGTPNVLSLTKRSESTSTGAQTRARTS